MSVAYVLRTLRCALLGCRPLCNYEREGVVWVCVRCDRPTYNPRALR